MYGLLEDASAVLVVFKLIEAGAGWGQHHNVSGFGKLGGEELNYSSDIDLMLVYDDEGQTAGRRPVGNDEFFARAGSEMIRLLSVDAYDRRTKSSR